MFFINYFRKNKRDFLMKYTRDSDRFVRQIQTQKKLRLNRSFRAIDGARTRGLDLGKVARYQLRHYRISGWWESNPRIQLGRLVFYHWTTPAQLVVCASLSHQRRLVYMMKLYLSTLNLNFFYFFNNIYKSSSDKQFVTQIKSSVSLLSSIPNNCYAVYQKELSLLLI